MRERPILFKGAMVRALLAGTKTQTRRALKHQPMEVLPMDGDWAGRQWVTLEQREPEPKGGVIRCRFGEPGDRLWVRESWAQATDFGNFTGEHFYRASYRNGGAYDDVKKWKPSIHMPRWACRLVLDVISVHVERLQDISEADAMAEGVERTVTGDGWRRYTSDRAQELAGMPPCETPTQSYRTLWETINGAGSWDLNPFVWSIHFTRVEADHG